MNRVGVLIATGFKQVSRKYRKLARIPAGKTGLEALAEVAPDLAAHFLAQAQERAADHYRSRYATGEDAVELSDEDFKEYLAKTGRAPIL
jgi:hypothetical protein